ncbi:holin, HP1 family [Pasteurella testudinis DSM 23072]|uniref:Holin, HP1 family n=1 Tax=Pasteurella testudinis DSM 23072 TaxID=1122938 RepID=A0A1W1UMW9_9PAST|nr:phage holin [Pasteurella testudinis]SMB82442.1 holin, HP1 family [Pasteurella testudinis DSM 23072]SUB52206.1 Uncharacterised protein [Pasteurella testudinis]
MIKDYSGATSYIGSIVAVLSGLSISDWAAIFGILFGFATLLTNMYYKRKEHQIKLKELELKIEKERGYQRETY